MSQQHKLNERPKLSGFMASRRPSGLKGLHHAAYRCKNTVETRKFYEGFLGLLLVEALHIRLPSGEDVLHTFFQLDDGSALAFFDAPLRPFDFKDQSDFDLHIAFEVSDQTVLEQFMAKGKALGMEVRGISDHDFIHSIYFRDPNGYVIELANVPDKVSNHFDRARIEASAVVDGFMSSVRGIGNAKAIINTDDWQARKDSKEKGERGSKL
jgi:catechol 2,3-dioxygenase-like lactoylglutathione lyase family enzyme